MAQIHGFERFINSTFGLPQQILFRLLRAAQDPNVDLLSEEGLLDASLIPGLGFFDKDRQDVQMPEMVERTNKLTGMDLDPEGLGAQLGVGILTDPLTFFTGGLTALGRGGAALNKAKNVGKVKKGIEAIGEGATLAQTRGIMKEALGGVLKSGERRKIEKALRETGTEAFAKQGDETLDVVGKLARDRELRISAPFFNMAGKGIYRTQKESNWVSLVGKNIPGVSPLFGAIGKGLSKVPGIRDVVKSFNGFGAGLKASGLAGLTTATSGTVGKSAIDAFDGGVLSSVATDIRAVLDTPETIAKSMGKFKRSLARGASREEAFVRDVLHRDVADDQIAEVAAEGMQAMGIKSLDELSEADIHGFMSDQQAMVDQLNVDKVNATTNRAVRDLKDEFGDTVGFKVGKKIRDLGRIIFNADTPIRSLVSGIQKGRSTDARAVEYVEGRVIAMNKAIKLDAEKLGMTPVETEQFYMMRLQGDVLDEELQETARMMGLTQDVEAFAKSRENLAFRLTRLSELVMGFAKDKPQMEAMAKGYANIAESIGHGTKARAFFDEAKSFKLVGEVPALGGSPLNRRPILVGRQGHAVHAGNMSDNGLALVEARHLKNATAKAPTRAQEQAAIDKFATLEDLQVSFPTIAEDAKGLMTEFELPAHEIIRNLKRARKGRIKFLTRSKNSETGVVPGRVKLTEEQSKRWELAAKDFNPIPERTIDLKLLSKNERAELYDIQNLMELRASGKEAKLAKSRPSIETIEAGPREASSIWSEQPARYDGADIEFSKLPEGADAIAQIHVMSDELKRAGKLPTPAFMDELDSAVIRASRAFTGPIDEMLDAAGATHFRATAHKTRMRIMNEALEFGLMSAGSPIGYIGRIMGRSGSKALEEVFGRREIRTVLSDAMPQLSSGFQRNLDALPVEDLNEAFKVLSVADNPTAKAAAEEIEAMARKSGLKLGKFETSPQQVLGARLAQGQTRYSIAESAADMLQATADANQVIAGRVVKVVRGAGKQIAEELETLNKTVTRGSKTTLTEIENVSNTQRMSGLLVKQDDDVHRFIPFNEVGRSGGLLPLGGEGALQDALKLGPENAADIEKALDDIGTANAFSLRSSRGKFEANNILTSLDDGQIKQLEGQHVMFGDTNVLGGMANAHQAQWKHSSEMGAMFDSATFTVKKWQTVYRPGFHITNAAGAFFQSRVLGVSAKNSAMGMHDAMRFMNGNPKAAAVYDQMALHMSSADGLTGFAKRKRKLVPNLEFLRVIRRAGRDGVDSKVSAADLEKFGLQPEDLIFRAGGQEHHIGDILDAMAKEGLFATFTNNGLRGSSSVSEAMFKLRSSVLDEGSAAKNFFGEGVETASEASEAFARLSVTFAQLREGVDLQHAVINAKRATVDYAQLTEAEQGIKRFVNFYTFPRRYIPVAAKHFAEDPAAIAKVSAFLKAGKSTGVTKEENGAVTLDVDALLKETLGVSTGTGVGINASRINPNLEMAKYLESFGEIMLNTADAASELVGNAPGMDPSKAGVSAARQELMSGQTDQPFSMGTIPTAIFGAFQGDSPLKEVSDAFWTTRILFQPEDPLGEKTKWTALLDGVLTGTKTARPEHEAKLVEFQYKRLIGELNKKAQASQDPEHVQALREEALRLNDIARERLKKRRGI